MPLQDRTEEMVDAGVILSFAEIKIPGPCSRFVTIKMYWPKTVRVEAETIAPADLEKTFTSTCPWAQSPGMN